MPATDTQSQRANSLVVSGIVLFLTGSIIHLTALPGTFFWDDYDWVVNNPLIRADDGLYKIWFTADYDYWPLTYSMFWFERRMWGEWAPPSRVINQLFHGANCVLLWWLLRRLQVPGAWLCALIFAVHPVNVESTVWISQRKTVLSTAFVFGAALCFLRFDRSRQKLAYVAALILFLLGLVTKVAVVMWPFVPLLCIWWQRGKLVLRDFIVATPFFLISLVLGLLGSLARGTQSGIELARTDGFASRLAIAGKAVWFYLYKLLLPINLSVVYPRWKTNDPTVADFLPLLALVVAFALFWRFRNAWGRPCLAGFGYYVLNLFPALGFLAIQFMRYSLVADHWQYLAMPGALAVFVGTATVWFQRDSQRLWIGKLSAAVLVLLLSCASLSEARVWAGADNKPIWRDVLCKNPNSELPHLRLGFLLATEGDFEGATRHICEAAMHTVPPVRWGPPRVDPERWRKSVQNPYAHLRMHGVPEEARINYALGIAYYVMGQYRRAADSLIPAVNAAPEFAAAHYNLSLAFEALGAYEPATAERDIAARLAAQQTEGDSRPPALNRKAG